MKDRIICLYFKLGNPYCVCSISEPILRYNPKKEVKKPNTNTLCDLDLRPWIKPLGQLLHYYKFMRKENTNE